MVAAGATGPEGSSDFAVVRLLPDGTADRAFGQGRRATSDFASAGSESPDAAAALAVGADGRIAVAGTSGASVAVVRYLADGRPDASFGTGGTVLTAPPPDGTARAEAVAVEPDGAVVIAGTVIDGSDDADFLVVRYRPDGSPDSGFGSAGIVTTGFGPDGETALDAASGLALLPGGGIVVAGRTGPRSSVTPGEDLSDVALARYRPDGTLDAAFGTGGRVVTDVGPDDAGSQDAADAVVPLSDGAVLVAGTTGPKADDVLAARYRSDGSLDPAFGSGGTAAADLAAGDESFDRAVALAIQPDGKLVVAGRAGQSNRPVPALARFRADGSPDRSFGTDGRLVGGPDSGRRGDGFASLGLASDGKLVTAGGVGGAPVVTRYQGDPAVSVSDAVTAEGDQRFATATFTVTMNGTSPEPVRVSFTTEDGSPSSPQAAQVDPSAVATADSNYRPTRGSLTFAPGGPATQTVTVEVPPDDLHEGDHRFVLRLSDPENVGGLPRPVGTGTIEDDDPYAFVLQATGYRMAAGDGGVFTFGAAPFHSSAARGQPGAPPIVGIAGSGRGGYWLADREGQVYAFGDAPFLGDRRGGQACSIGPLPPGQGQPKGRCTAPPPIVAIAARSGERGYR